MLRRCPRSGKLTVTCAGAAACRRFDQQSPGGIADLITHDKVADVGVNPVCMVQILHEILRADPFVLHHIGNGSGCRDHKAPGERLHDLVGGDVHGNDSAQRSRGGVPHDCPVSDPGVHHEFLPAQEEEPHVDAEGSLEFEEERVGPDQRQCEIRRSCRLRAFERHAPLPGHTHECRVARLHARPKLTRRKVANISDGSRLRRAAGGNDTRRHEGRCNGLRPATVHRDLRDILSRSPVFPSSSFRAKFHCSSARSGSFSRK